MSKKIKQLELALEALKQEKADVEARLDAAARALYDAEREARRSRKPTAVMLAILHKLKRGAVIKCRTYYPYSYRVVGDAIQPISSSVFDGLKLRELITEGGRDGMMYVYEISEHGRNLVESDSSSKSLQRSDVTCVSVNG